MIKIKNGFATPMVAEHTTRTFQGAIYDQNGELIVNSQRIITKSNEWNPADPKKITDTKINKLIKGKSLYLGHYTGHYGHFLLETLNRLWFLIKHPNLTEEYDNFIYHPFLHKTPPFKKFSPAKITFESFGIDLKKIIILSEAVQLEEIDVPNPMFNINHNVNQIMGSVYKNILSHVDHLDSAKISLIKRLQGWPKHGRLKIYISRRKAKGYHPMQNEIEIENLFSDFGFMIMHPERWSFEQQVSLFSRSDIIAGVEGSALHNSLFMNEGKKVIAIGTPRVPSGNIFNQELCNQLSGVHSTFIEFKGDIKSKNRAIYDLLFLKNKLNEILY